MVWAESAPLDESAFEREIIPRLIKRLDSPERSDAIRELASLGPLARSAAPSLMRRFSVAPKDEKTEIASAIGAIGSDDPRDAQAIAELLKDTDTIIVTASFMALSEMDKASAGLMPEMLKVLQSGKVMDFYALHAMSFHGPIATAALPHYRGEISSDDIRAAARGLRFSWTIAPSDPVLLDIARREIQRGSWERRCALAVTLADGEDVPETVAAELNRSGILERKECRGTRERLVHAMPYMFLTPADRQYVGGATVPASTEYPKVHIRLTLPKKTYFAGAVIDVTPNLIASGGDAPIGPHQRFSADSNNIYGLYLCPDVVALNGVPVRYPSALPSNAFASMMANGVVGPPERCSSGFGSPAHVFIRKPGHYRLVLDETNVHIGTSTGPLVHLLAEPVEINVVKASDEVVGKALKEIRADLEGSDVMARGWAATRLQNMTDQRVLPLLVGALEDEYKNVIGPAMRGLLEYPEPSAVAKAVKDAIRDGHPIKSDATKLFADILSRTELGWPKTDARSMQRADSSAQRWRMLLNYRREQLLAAKSLSPSEILDGLENGLVSPQRPGVCAAAFNMVLDGNKDAMFRGYYAVISECGSKSYIPQLWEIVHDVHHKGYDKAYALMKLRELGEKNWLAETLADFASTKPTMRCNMNDPFIAALAESPKQVASILEQKLISGDHENMVCAARFLAFLDEPGLNPPKVPLDLTHMRVALTSGSSLDEEVCTTMAYFMLHRAPRDAYELVNAVLSQRMMKGESGYSSAFHVLALLPVDISSERIRKLLNSPDADVGAAMAQGLWMAGVSPALGTASSSAALAPALKKYFPDLLVYFKTGSNAIGRQFAGRALNAITGVGGDVPVSSEPGAQRVRIAEWEEWFKRADAR